MYGRNEEKKTMDTNDVKTDTTAQPDVQSTTDQTTEPTVQDILAKIPKEELEKLLAPEIDRRVNRVARERDEYKTKYSATLTEEQKRAAELEEARRQFEIEREEFNRTKTETLVLEELAIRKWPVSLKPFLYDSDKDSVKAKADTLNSIISEQVRLAVEDKLKSSSFVPPTGSGNTAGQISREDLQKLSPAEISKLRKEGRLSHLMQ